MNSNLNDEKFVDHLTIILINVNHGFLSNYVAMSVVIYFKCKYGIVMDNCFVQVWDKVCYWVCLISNGDMAGSFSFSLSSSEINN